MNINENIWGAESTWRNALTTPVTVSTNSEASQKLKALELAKVKISTENFTIADGLKNQVLDKSEDFDNSVSFWNVGGTAHFHKTLIPNFYIDLNYTNFEESLKDISDYTVYTDSSSDGLLPDSVPLYLYCKTVEVAENFPVLTGDWYKYDNKSINIKSVGRPVNDHLDVNCYYPNLLDNWCKRPQYNISDNIDTVEPTVNNYARIAPVMDFDYSRVLAVPQLIAEGQYDVGLDPTSIYNWVKNKMGGFNLNYKGFSRFSVSLMCTKANNTKYVVNDESLCFNMIEKSVFAKSNAMLTDEEDPDSIKKIYEFNYNDAQNAFGVYYGQNIINTAFATNDVLLGGHHTYDMNIGDEGELNDSLYHTDTTTDLYENARSVVFSRQPAPITNANDYSEHYNIGGLGLMYVDTLNTSTPWKYEVYMDENDYYHLRVYLDLHWFKNEDPKDTDQDLCKRIRDYFLRQTAYLGFQFTDNIEVNDVKGSDRFRKDPTDPTLPTGWYVPKFYNDNGVLTTTGEYTHNPENDLDNYPNALWTNNLRDSTTPTPPTPVDPDEDSGDLTTNITPSTVTSSTKYFKLSANDILTLVATLNGGYNVKEGNTLEQQLLTDFKGTNPYEYINSVVWFPFNVTASNAYADIVMGAYNSGMNKPVIELNNNNTVLNFGTTHIKRTFNDFRDFAPYTKLQLDIPFCGKVELDTKVFMNHDLSLYIFYDITSGKCTALVYRDSLLYQTLDGVCGVNIPLTAVNMAQYQNAIAQLENGMKQTQLAKDTAMINSGANYLKSWASLGKNIGGIITGGSRQKASGIEGSFSSGVGILGGMNDLVATKSSYEYQQEMLDYSLEHTAPTATVIGSSDPLNNLVCDFRARLLYVRCTLLEGYSESVYKKTVGYATVKNTTLGNCHGFTIATNLRTDGITATTKEKELLNQALLNGVILD